MTRRKSNKRALTLSLLSLLLCMAMLVGSTFAWFTDNATTSVNKIESGTLQIGLYTDEACTQTAEGKTLSFTKAGENVLWEPGATWTLPTLYIKNEGNLAAKYKVEITGINGDAKLNEVIDWTINDGSTDGTGHLTKDQTQAITISGTMQTTAGNDYQGLTIDGIGITVRATQDTVEFDSDDNQYDQGAQYDIPPTTSWDDNASNAEADIQVDETAKTIKIYTAAGLAQFAKNVNETKNNYKDYNVTLENDIDLAGNIWEPIGQTGVCCFSGSFDGNGHTIRNMYVDETADDSATNAAGFFGWTTSYALSYTDVKFENATVKGNQYVGVLAGYVESVGATTISDIAVSNSSVSCTYDKAGGLIGMINPSPVVISNCTVSNTTVTACRDAGQMVGCLYTSSNTTYNGTAANVTVTQNSTDLTGGDDGKEGSNLKNELVGRVL